jgi:hypothetical protein
MLRVRSKLYILHFDTEVLAENLDLELDIHLQTFNVINTPENTKNSMSQRIRRTENDRILAPRESSARKEQQRLASLSRILK